jgi:hypothetical protein
LGEKLGTPLFLVKNKEKKKRETRSYGAFGKKNILEKKNRDLRSFEFGNKE